MPSKLAGSLAPDVRRGTYTRNLPEPPGTNPEPPGILTRNQNNKNQK